MHEGTAEHGKYYECRECRHRVTTDSTRSSCPECGGEVRNIAVPRD